MQKVTAQDIYNMLIEKENIKAENGFITFKLSDVSIVVKRKDVVGNILQEWLEGWIKARDIFFRPNPNTQMPPDIFLDENPTIGRLEVKAFNRNSNPGFDIADFKAFVNELIEHPYHLDTDFLIFGYTMDENSGAVVVKDLWLKKIWEITRPMDNWPLTLQYSNGSVRKLRPGNWYSKKTKGKVFECKEHYISAFEELVYQCPDTRNAASQWKNKFKRSYKNHYKTDIDIPRWDDIKDIYSK